MKPITIRAAVTDDRREHQLVKRFDGDPVTDNGPIPLHLARNVPPASTRSTTA